MKTMFLVMKDHLPLPIILIQQGYELSIHAGF
jgi:hypothetical protein